MPAYYGRVAWEAHNSASGALIVNVHHLEIDTLSSPPNWDSIAGDIDVWLSTEYRNILSTADTFDQMVVTDENYPGSTHGQGVRTHAIAGTRTLSDTSFSPGICTVAQFKTSVAKRYARGRMFMPPAYSSAAGAPGGGWNPANTYATTCDAFLNKLKAGTTVGSTSYVPVVFSRHQVAVGATPFAFKITSAAGGSKQHFLRSRTTSP